MEFRQLEELKIRANQVRYETGREKNTAERIGSLFFDIISEMGCIYTSTNKRVFYVCYLSVILSITSILIHFFEIETISVAGADLLGWLVGILAILVTILIGFQIYKSIDLEKQIDKKIHRY